MKVKPAREATPAALPPRTVVGVVGEPPNPRLREEVQRLRALGLGALEVRADLFADTRTALEWPGAVPDLPVLFTIRIAAQGGKFVGEEEERLDLYRAAVSAGARWVDAEWGTQAAAALAGEGAPLILSHHDFERTQDAEGLLRLGEAMPALPCLAIKVVPTAQRLADAVRILSWVREAPPGGPRRIGFAMGPAGFASRALALAWGSAFTYASLGKPSAPGQVPAREFLEVYRPLERGPGTRLLGVAGRPVGHSLSPHLHNPALAARGIDALYVPFHLESFEEVLAALDPLGIDGLSVTIPFKEEAYRAADAADERSRAAGASNTVRVERGRGSARTVRAFNTDVDGVLRPLRRRVGDLRGVRTAVLGNGGAARGAVRALLEAGASPTLYYRNEERGGPVARALGVPGRFLEDLEPGRERIIINATSLGLKPEDGSPVPPAAFGPATIAFDMIYDPPRTRFLEDASAAGAITIGGGEMLVSQAVEQFRIFTGQEVAYEELEANLERGRDLRKETGR